MAGMTALGLMSGTSMDGIDAALLRTDGENLVELGPTAFFSYPAAFRREIEDGLDVRAREAFDSEQMSHGLDLRYMRGGMPSFTARK